jgi:hypothetical protein
MPHYLRLSEAKSALERGQQIEQFLGSFQAEGQMAVRYTVISREKTKVVATIYEVWQPLNSLSFDIVNFPPVKNRPPDEFHFDTLEEACSFLEYRNGASWGKFVNQGAISDEYRAFRTGKLTSTSSLDIRPKS